MTITYVAAALAIIAFCLWVTARAIARDQRKAREAELDRRLTKWFEGIERREAWERHLELSEESRQAGEDTRAEFARLDEEIRRVQARNLELWEEACQAARDSNADTARLHRGILRLHRKSRDILEGDK